jgi:hypothetical protein
MIILLMEHDARDTFKVTATLEQLYVQLYSIMLKCD